MAIRRLNKESAMRIVDRIAEGDTQASAVEAEGFSGEKASATLAKAVEDPDVALAAVRALNRTAATWRKLVTNAKMSLADVLDPETWKGDDAPRFSDRNQAAKIVLDALRAIDAKSLSEKARREDEQSDEDAAREILGAHGPN